MCESALSVKVKQHSVLKASRASGKRVECPTHRFHSGRLSLVGLLLSSHTDLPSPRRYCQSSVNVCVCVCVRESYVLLSFDPLVCELNGFQVLKMQLHESVNLQKRANEGERVTNAPKHTRDVL